MNAKDYAYMYTRQFVKFEDQTKEELHKLDKIAIDYLCEIHDRKAADRKAKKETDQKILDAENAVMHLHRRLLEHFRQTEQNCYTCCSLHFCDYTRKHFDEFHKAVEEKREIKQEDLHEHCCDQWKQAPSPKEVIANVRKIFEEVEQEMKEESEKLERLFPLENMLSEVEQRQKLNEIRKQDSSLICEIPNVGDRVMILFSHNDHRRKREFLQKGKSFEVTKVHLYKSKISEDRDNYYLKLKSEDLHDSFQISQREQRWIIVERKTNKSE